MIRLWDYVKIFCERASENSFTYLMLNNLGVILLLWLVAAIWIYYAACAGAPRRRICRLALGCYLFFFVKEIFRINRSIDVFSRGNSIPYLDVLINLILPHGVIEYLAFLLAAAFALLWLGRSLEEGSWHYPGHRALILPASLVVLAAAVESTITPYLYEIYLLSN